VPAPGVVLVGPPGSGKTTIATALADDLGYRYVDRERLLVQEFGSREGFLAAKETALPAMQTAIRRWMAEEPTPWIHETTALSERDFVEELRLLGALMVRLEVSRGAALERVGQRPAVSNFQTDAAATGRMWDICNDTHGQMLFDLIVATGAMNSEAAARSIHLAFRSRNG